MVIKIVANIKKVLFDFAFINIIDDYQKLYKNDSLLNKGSFNRFKIKFCYNNERNLILERSSAGRIAARARERYGGRPEKLNKLT